MKGKKILQQQTHRRLGEAERLRLRAELRDRKAIASFQRQSKAATGDKLKTRLGADKLKSKPKKNCGLVAKIEKVISEKVQEEEESKLALEQKKQKRREMNKNRKKRNFELRTKQGGVNMIGFGARLLRKLQSDTTEPE